MFKPKEDRLNYGQLLMPPVGYTLVRAVGTTYSLDLETLMSVCIALGIQESTDSTLTKNPFAILKSLQGLSEKLLIFCEAGQISPMPPDKSPLMLMLDKMIVPVKLKAIKGKGIPSFHPKTWTLQYEDAEGNQYFRFIVLSRNLTFDRSWDVAVSLDGKLTGGRHRSSYPIVDFLEYLKYNALEGVSLKTEKRRILNALIQDLPYVKFSLEDKRFLDFEIIPLGIGSADIDKDPLMTNTFHDLLIMSPFVSSGVLQSFDQRKQLKINNRHLITRTTELHKIAGKLESFKVFTMKDTVVEGEEIVSDDEPTKVQQQDIHAKMYMMTKDSSSTLYLGSMNASENGLHRNVEMLLKLSAYRYYLNIDQIEADLFGPDEKWNPFEEIDLSTVDNKEPEKNEKDELERVIKSICRLKSKAVIELSGDNYKVIVNFICPRDVFPNVDIAPARTVRTQPLSDKVVFDGLSALELTELYRITVKGESESLTRMMLIPTEMPIDRDDMVVRSILKDKRAFVDYLAFILGDDYVLSALEMNATTTSDKDKGLRSNEDGLPAIYEKMLKVAYREPERLKEIRQIIDRIADNEIIPDEFIQMYDTFTKTLKLK
ncbi:MAG: phospholipase D family protein [Prevotella sp.]|nr:phospholipase D family protein [Prevotella sp.]